MMLGYYTHLLTDFYWNDLTYGRLGVFDKNKNLIGLKMYNEKIYMAPKAELRKIKLMILNYFLKVYMKINVQIFLHMMKKC